MGATSHPQHIIIQGCTFFIFRPLTHLFKGQIKHFQGKSSILLRNVAPITLLLRIRFSVSAPLLHPCRGPKRKNIVNAKQEKRKQLYVTLLVEHIALSTLCPNINSTPTISFCLDTKFILFVLQMNPHDTRDTNLIMN